MNLREQIFYYSEGVIKFNEIGILFDPNFTKLFKRKHEVPGDTQGRNKLRNFQEAKYIYLVADPSSYANRQGYGEKEKHEYASATAGLPPDWMPDEVVKNCINIYIKHTWTVVHEQVYELLSTFHGYNKIVSFIRNNIENLYNNPKLKKEEIVELIAYYKELIKLGTDLPKIQQQLQEAVRQLNDNIGTDEFTHMRGTNLPAPDSADPENELKA